MLEGRKIALLRAEGGGVAEKLRELGATVLEVPMISFAPPSDHEALAAALAKDWDWIAVTSPAAARAIGTFRGKARFASVGPGTSQALRALGFGVDLEAKESLQEGLARELAPLAAGKTVLVPRSDLARDALVRGLVDAGARVTSIEAYRTVEGGDPTPLLEAWETLDAVCFTSASTARGLARRVPDLAARFKNGKPIAASMGPLTSSALREEGVQEPIEARDHTASGLAAVVAAALAPPSRP